MSDYIGTELGLFKHATNWKRYYGGMIAGHLGREVLEVGAGIGANTALFCNASHARWVCLEPDAKLAGEIQPQIAAGTLPRCCEVVTGTLGDLPADVRFDALMYIDVLEHISDDAAEVKNALRFLRPGGRLIVLSPAHQFLFSPFDASIGHYRRYSRRTLGAVVPAKVLVLRYVDSVGMLLSLANRVLLQQRMPTLKQIQFWDKKIIPLSRILDPLMGHRVGKSILGVWEK